MQRMVRPFQGQNTTICHVFCRALEAHKDDDTGPLYYPPQQLMTSTQAARASCYSQVWSHSLLCSPTPPPCPGGQPTLLT